MKIILLYVYIINNLHKYSGIMLYIYIYILTNDDLIDGPSRGCAGFYVGTYNRVNIFTEKTQ